MNPTDKEHKVLSDAEIETITRQKFAGLSKSLFKVILPGKVEFARAIEAAATAPLLARIAELEALSVTNIMLGVVPGWDGMGEEVYAKSVADVEKTLTDMCSRLEDYELGIKKHPDMVKRIEALEAELAKAHQINFRRFTTADAACAKLERDVADLQTKLDAAAVDAVRLDMALRKVLKAVHGYLPPDGETIENAMSEIIGALEGELDDTIDHMRAAVKDKP